MSENEIPCNNPSREEDHQHHHGDDAADNDSIIGKVKSRVSTILPNTISKWFSPTTTRDIGTDSCNGELSRRRRRRLNESDYEASVFDGDEQQQEESDGVSVKRRREIGEEPTRNINNDDDQKDNNSDDSEEDIDSRIFSPVITQPSTKRSRLEVNDATNVHHRQKFVSSTPATTTLAATVSNVHNRNKYMNLYGRTSQKEPAYNFSSTKIAPIAFGKNLTDSRSHFGSADIIDLVPEEATEEDIFHIQSKMSSRRSLNIPSTYSEPLIGLTNLKRQSLASVKESLPYSSRSSSVFGGRPTRTSTTIYETEDQYDFTQRKINQKNKAVAATVTNQAAANENEDDDVDDDEGNEEDGDDTDRDLGLPDDNEEIQEIAKLTNKKIGKKRKYPNGRTSSANDFCENSILGDTASESGESCRDNSSDVRQKTGLFNAMGNKSNVGGNTRNSSRTSSLGNGLNFYSHLEGRKSLFGEKDHLTNNQLNNSTLSLTSLNRRQFNSSIYGSTSALSDSRLLNTFSPFYKGKTIYGGAAAYNKFANSASSSATSMRIAPTLIRPTSSLSTLSSSNNSLNYNNEPGGISTATTISNTAKRILELINDFPTPLNDAKKMASSVRTNTNLRLNQRFSEADLNASRSVRLMNVRTPYTRSAVILNPTANDNNKNKQLPPNKELQVPSMSQLLQMKRLQSTTERSRQITKNRPAHNFIDYKLPMAAASQDNVTALVNNSNKHISKMKNKITNSGRLSSNKASSSAAVENEDAPPPVNLPNIAFPHMESMPKIDISVPNYKKTAIEIGETYVSSGGDIEMSSLLHDKTKGNYNKKGTQNAFNFNQNEMKKDNDTGINNTTISNKSPMNLLNFKAANTISASLLPSNAVVTSVDYLSDSTTFKFSSPLDLPTPNVDIGSMKSSNYTFSSPISIEEKKSTNTISVAQTSAVPKLKTTGSVLDVLKKPVEMTPVSVTDSSPVKSTTMPFGDSFKKSSNEWECSVCLVRNKEYQNTCVACSTSRNNQSSAASELSIVKSSFGDAFKPKENSWSCPTCMITNKSDVNECVACNEKKPMQATDAASSTNVPKMMIPPSTTSSSFKMIAASQASAKWECPACMTHNDDTRNKCVCCEQAKPGVNSNKDVPTFSFGASSASKFTFGFGAMSGEKENDMRKESTSTSFVVSTSSEQAKSVPLADENNKISIKTAPTAGGFKFGIKPADSAADSSTEPTTTGFKFGLTNANVKTTTATTTAAATTMVTAPPILSEKQLGGFVFGNTSGADVSSSSVKKSNEFSMPPSSSSANAGKINFPSTTSNEKKLEVPLITTQISTPATTAASSFSLGAPLSANFKPPTATSGGFTFGTLKPKETINTSEASSTGFSFKAPTTTSSYNNQISSSSAAANTNTFTFSNAAAAAPNSTTAVVAPIFGIASSSTTTTSTTLDTPKTTTFGFPNTPVSTVSSSSASLAKINSPFKSPIVSSSTSTSNATTGVNLFGSIQSSSPSFGTVSSEAVNKNPFFGQTLSSASSSTVSKTAASSVFGTTSTSTAFGGFTNTTDGPATSAAVSPILPITNSGSNLFGCFSPTTTTATTTGGDVAKTQLPLFGSVSANANKPFVFGTSPTTVSTGSAITSPTLSSSTSSSSSVPRWPKNSFIFGSATNANNDNGTGSKSTSAASSIFGGFNAISQKQQQQQQQQPAAAASPSQNSSLQSPPSIFGQSTMATNNFSGATSAASTGLFGSNATPTPTGLFGLPAAATAQPQPTFGGNSLTTFGGSTSSNPPAAFGSATSANPPTFGSFSSGFGGVATNTPAATDTSTDSSSSASKKSKGFNFGDAATQQTLPTGGFSFAMPANNNNNNTSLGIAKPASFNFTGLGTTPTFNFTGSSEQTNQSSQPFQFGAALHNQAPTTFNFSGAASEATANQPFQFNASSAVNSNIFAPPPTTGLQSAQQSRRKMRPQTCRKTSRQEHRN